MARQMETALLRNLFCLGVMKAAPLSIQTLLYENGGYNRCGSVEDTYYAGQKSTGVHTAQGVELSFLESYDTLRNMRTMTTITQQEQNTCLIMANQTTHEVMLLQEPDYVPSVEVDNTAFDEKHADRFTMDGRSLRMDGYYDMASYQCNMAALLQLGAWFDYLLFQ